MEQIPIEIIYDILLHVSYKDIMNYCASNRKSLEIYHDTSFWWAKLDWDFSTLCVCGKQLLPSYYVKNFGQMDNIQNIYVKWLNDRNEPILLRNNDIGAIIFNAHKNGYIDSDDVRNVLQTLIRGDFLDELKHLFNDYILSYSTDANNTAIYAVTYDKLNILKWIIVRTVWVFDKMNPEIDLSYLLDIATSTHIFDWLKQNGAGPI